MKIKSLFFLASALLAISSCATRNSGGSQDNQKKYWCGTYQNPLFIQNKNGTFYNSEVADPCVVRGDDGYVYCFSTQGRVLRSEDGCEWYSYSESIIPRPKWGDGYATNPAIWAPDVVKVKNKWIYYYSLSAWGGACGIGYATADEVGGPYTDQGCLFTTKEVGDERSLGVQNSIDQQVIVDEDGSVYMVFGSFVGCYLVQLTDDGMSLYSPDSSKTGYEYQRENKVLVAGKPTGFDGRNNYEGSWIFKRGDYWYYMGSLGSCCNGRDSTYHVLCGKADSITGPYYGSDGRKMNENYEEGAAGDLVVFSSPENTLTKGTGHNSVIVDGAGDFWWYGHCYYEFDNFATRHLAMDKLEWDENDMPYVETQELSYNEELDGPRWLED